MPLEAPAQNVAADAVTAAFPYVAIFDGDPTAGGTELTGGSPAYARKQLDFSGAATGGVDSAAATVTFDIPAGATVAWAALFDALTAGTRGAYGQLPASEVYAAQGTYDLTAADLQIT